jgi:5'-methylthioadenosine phosphorylase
MTGMPEAALAREIGLNYAALCPIANQAAGRGESANGIRYTDLMAKLDLTMQKVRLLIEAIVLIY